MLGETAAAARLFREAVGIVLRNPDRDRRVSQAVLQDIGLFYASRGRFQEADAYLQQAVTIARLSGGESGPGMAKAMFCLGLLYLSEGRLRDADGLLVPAVKTLRDRLASGHPDRLSAEFAVGILYGAEGRLGEAERILGEA